MNDRVAGYRGLVESVAQRLVRTRRAQQVGAEFDDLVQEGLIAVFKKLRDGVDVVGEAHVRDRMRDYIKWLGRTEFVPYEEMLPLDDSVPAP